MNSDPQRTRFLCTLSQPRARPTNIEILHAGFHVQLGVGDSAFLGRSDFSNRYFPPKNYEAIYEAIFVNWITLQLL